MTKHDDLSVGDYIVLVECHEIEAYCPYNIYHEDFIPPKFDGRPFEILAVSLPFVCVTNGPQTFAIDLHAWGVQKVTREYAKAMAHANGCVTVERRKKNKRSVFAAAKQRQAPPDPQACPRCGHRMRQVLQAGGSGWFLICPQCNNNGGPVQIVHPQ